jgi:hypothetical protein
MLPSEYPVPAFSAVHIKPSMLGDRFDGEPALRFSFENHVSRSHLAGGWISVAIRSRSQSDLDAEIGSDGGIAHDAEKKFERQNVQVRCYNGYRGLLQHSTLVRVLLAIPDSVAATFVCFHPLSLHG